VRKNELTWTQRRRLAPEEAPTGVRRLTRDDLGVVFQPIVDLANGRAFAFEALARCSHPDYPSPPVLFDAAVKEDACGQVGRIVREVAFSTCGDVALFVNLHPQELSSHWLVQPDDPIGFHARPVYLEVTESSAITHFDLCMSILKELGRRTGARLVVDDFGAGYSNLERVVHLAPDIIKLDLALTRDIHKHKAKQTVVRHMVAMCRDLGAGVVAEGVETLEELHCVRDLGVGYAQGYLLARPAAPPPRHAWPVGARPATPSRRPAAASGRNSKPPSRRA
jgi:EAL domain-containing protein (putative c-di-GMP-specific phosphodiesterase class I)